MSRGFGRVQYWLLGCIGNEPMTFEQILARAYPEFFKGGHTDITKWLGSSNCSLTRSLRRALGKLCDLDIIQVKGKRPHRYYLHRLFAADEHNAKLIELSYRCLEHEEGETLEAKNAAGRAHFKKVLDKLATGQI